MIILTLTGEVVYDLQMKKTRLTTHCLSGVHTLLEMKVMVSMMRFQGSSSSKFIFENSSTKII
jgi:hypothetical protein